jgi:hypothetical protein
MGNFCGSDSEGQEVKVYGDYFNSDTRSILNILMHCGITPKLIIVDTLGDLNSAERRHYRSHENPADALPMVVHGPYKIMSNMEHTLRYFENTFPHVKESLFDCITSDNFKRYVKWH